MAKRIWTFEKSLMLYKLVMLYFDAYETWATTSIPSKNSFDYDQFCKDMSDLFGAKSGEAVKNQIAWATTGQEKIDEPYVETWYRNKVAAKEAGFISNKNMPKQILCEY